VLVPAYNEGAVIASTLADLRRDFDHVVVVDDGSADDTATVARAAGATVVRHPLNRGQGAALKTGLEYVRSRTAAEHCITFDADGQHLVSDAVAMLATARDQAIDVVLASRFLGRCEDMPTSRRLLLRSALRFSRVATKLPLTDTHNGLRVLSRQAFERIDLTQDRMAYATELEAAIARNELSWTEVPTTVRYTEYSRAKGQHNLNAVNIVFDLAWDRLRSAP
jgi:glycosyltransferase involved in cell wall biosynthesis